MADALKMMKMDSSMADFDEAWSKTPPTKKPKTADTVAAELEVETPPVPGKQSEPRSNGFMQTFATSTVLCSESLQP